MEARLMCDSFEQLKFQRNSKKEVVTLHRKAFVQFSLNEFYVT